MSNANFLRQHGHPVVDLGGCIVAFDSASRLTDPDLEDLIWRGVAAHIRVAESPGDEDLKNELARVRKLFDDYIAFVERQRGRKA